MDDPKKKILIIDDDKFLIDMYSIKFNEAGFDVNAVFNAKEALDKVDQGFRPDICLVDIIMPTMDGFQLVGELKKREGFDKVHIIFLTNLGQQDDINKGMELGADGYIVKASATPTEVVAKVNEIVSNK